MADIGNAVATHPGQQKQLGRLELVIRMVQTDPRNSHEAHVYLADKAGILQNPVLELDPTQFNGGIQVGNRITFTVKGVEQLQKSAGIGIAAIYSGQEQVYSAER